MSQQNLVEINNLTLHFTTPRGVVKALEDVRLDVRQGEILGLVGETGCGKTITSRSIMALLPKNAAVVSGSIRFGEIRDVFRLDEAQLLELRGNDIAMIFQDASRALNPVLRIGDQISEVFMFHRTDELVAEAIRVVGSSRYSRFRKSFTIRFLRRFSEASDSVGLRIASKIPRLKSFKKVLEGVARAWSVRLLSLVRITLPEKRVDQYPHEISGGMRQRAMIAMAVACRPKLLIADEPTTALDVTTQYHILKLIRDLRDEFKTTVLLVTHNFGVVAEVCDRVAVMYAGTIAEVGATDTIFSRPLHPYTQGLLGAIHEIGDAEDPKEIPGFVPNLVNPPSGCRFHPRCPYAEEVCRRRLPPLVEVEKDHLVACFPVQRSFGLKVEEEGHE